MINLYTIGFTKKSANDFFSILKKNNIRKIIDIRLNNTSQLAGFAKGKDLEYFLDTILKIPYEHKINFAPTKEILDSYKKKEMNWILYEEQYLNLLKKRKIEKEFSIEDFDNACFLCSEDSSEFCHRRLLVKYITDNLTKSTKEIKVNHL